MIILILAPLFHLCLSEESFTVQKDLLERDSVLTTANDFDLPFSLPTVDKGESVRSKRETDYGAAVTFVLNDILRERRYDRRIRPNYLGKPVEVGVTLFICAIGRVSEVTMDVTLDFYFRQFWKDHRLNFAKLWDEEIAVSGDLLREIWRPDTFFVNAKLGTYHQVTALNTFLRISPDGNVTQSIRLTVTASCPMNFKYFPMDSQRCSLEIESYGFSERDITFRWGRVNQTSVAFAPHVYLPQYKIRGHREFISHITTSTGNYSRMYVHIYLQRMLGAYLIQIYLPSFLVVLVSILSLWISRDSAPARVGLGITTVLTMTTVISGTNVSLPKISYLKAIDVYLVSCFIMVFAALLEYAAVTYTEKRCRMVEDLHHRLPLDSMDSGDEFELQCCNYCRMHNIKASDIEKYSRVVFPVTFACFNIFYWIMYLNLSFVVDEDGFIPA